MAAEHDKLKGEKPNQLADIVDDMEAVAKENARETPAEGKYVIEDTYKDREIDLVAEGEEDPSIYVRTSTLLPMEKLAADQVRIIGVGGIGRQVGLQVAASGVGSAVLYDDDEITKTNVSTQGYPYLDVGELKVKSLLYNMNEVTPCGIFMGYESKFPLEEDFDIDLADKQGGPTFCCVDKIGERIKIFEALHNCPLWVDGRMAAETGRVITILFEDKDDRKYYESTLFKQEEQEPQKCTEKATIYCGSYIAAIMLSQYMRWARGLINPDDPYRDMMFSLKTLELFPYKQPVEKKQVKNKKAKNRRKGGAVGRKSKK